jgi:hypothetical protein
MQAASKSLSDKAACIDLKIAAVNCLAAVPESLKPSAVMPIALKILEATTTFKSGVWVLAEAVGR